ncbi:hypothetical protein M422DRAFT_49556 [Sphaerobolus stellatus SS14]|uniref:Uncharacterized protein n=1 Tax=Sphaerobolus stellatus (strain SS14) TaxID=990650 RepID=A0A0C9VP01_SPHS4|nr:hypothetical protein M422DRAFT_49556 [Sphaerobolus stellatus SS14]
MSEKMQDQHISTMRRLSTLLSGGHAASLKVKKDKKTGEKEKHSFFSIGKTKKSTKEKMMVKETVKSAPKGSKIVLVTGANEGVGLEFVKQFAGEPNTYVIALSKAAADRAPELRALATAAAKTTDNIRIVRLDVTSSKSIESAVKDINELTNGRIDLLINAASTATDPNVKVWDLKGTELEQELQNNLIGPISFTNALLPFLKPAPMEESAPMMKDESAAPMMEEPASMMKDEAAPMMKEPAPMMKDKAAAPQIDVPAIDAMAANRMEKMDGMKMDSMKMDA